MSGMSGHAGIGRSRRRRVLGLTCVEAHIVESFESRSLLSAATVHVPATRDTTIYSVPDGNLANGAGEYIVVGGSSGTAAARRGLVQFDLTAAGIPAGSTILDVVLTMHLSQSNGTPVSVDVHRITSPWMEAGSNAPGNEVDGGQAHEFDATWTYSIFDGVFWQTPGGDFSGVSASTTVDVLGAWEWTGAGLIADVQQWLNEPTENQGWLIKGAESGTDIKAFTSRNSDNVALRPALEVSYEAPILPPLISGRQFNDLNGDGLRLSPTVLSLNLQFSQGRNFFNLYGGNEYWFKSGSDSLWYFLRPDGSVTRWDGAAGKLTGTVVERVDPASWHNPDCLLGSPARQPEGWVNGITMELVNSDGEVVDRTITRSIDLNSDGLIQDELERGWYRFGSIIPGEYTVRPVVSGGWFQSTNSNSGLAYQAFVIDSTLGLRFDGNYRQNFGGQGERWLRGTAGWYYLTPNGDFYRWNGQGITAAKPLTGTLVATFSAGYYRAPWLLYAAVNPRQNIQTGSAVTGVDFGSYQPVSVRGQTWNDVNPDGKRNPPEYASARRVNPPVGVPADTTRHEWYMILLPEGGHPLPANPIYREAYFYVTDQGQVFQWSQATGSVAITTVSGKAGLSPAAVAQYAFAAEPLVSGVTIQLLDEFGNVVATTTSIDRDLNSNGSIQPDDERGWYEFTGLRPGRYSVRQVVSSGAIQTSHSTATLQVTAQSLQQQYGFKAASNDHYNFGGRRERWFQNRSNAWFYITPQGAVYEWNKASGGNLGLVKGTLVGQLSGSHYLNLNLLFQPATISLTLDANQSGTIDFGACRLVDSLFADLAPLLL